jgi:DNA-binding transcriptional regulator YiaG
MLTTASSEVNPWDPWDPWALAPFGCQGSGRVIESLEKASSFRLPELAPLTSGQLTACGIGLASWMLFHEATTSGPVEFIHTTLKAHASAEIAHSPAQMLAAVRANLSLSMVELAAALELERPTIYAWLGGRSEPQERNRRRLQRLFEVARRWSLLSSFPLGARARHPDQHGTSLLDLLRSGRFEEAETRLDALAQARPVEEPKRPRSIQQVLARHGLEDRIRPNREEVDRLTGKRTAPE